MAEPGRCRQCNKPLPPPKPKGRRRFCDTACRNAYWGAPLDRRPTFENEARRG